MTGSSQATVPFTEALADRYAKTRRKSEDLCAPLSVDDCNVQTMPDVSPTKWHLAHTTWFFETFVLLPHAPGYRVFHEQFGYLFNSYYEAVGPRHARPHRGHLSRPTLDEVWAYRRHVDAAMLQFLQQALAAELAPLVRLGLEHEQQHQELMLTDIKHVLGTNPLQPAYHRGPPHLKVVDANAVPRQQWQSYPEGLVKIGLDEAEFAFDNEFPRHHQWLNAFSMAQRPVTQGEWLEFIADDGYSTASLWLSDGWAWVNENRVDAPLYWSIQDGVWSRYTMYGRVELDSSDQRARPVSHINFFEAAAFALWAGARLPSEAEWEYAAVAALSQAGQAERLQGDFQEQGEFEPQPLAEDHPGCRNRFFFGGVWEWTATSYAPYPGFVPPPGALGEYNSKFMASQQVLRGGSCVTPRSHIRPSYRNFFYPAQRWQYTGLRLARDV